MAQNHALVFGASGITGWAITNAIINGYPDTSPFQSVTALTNRPLSREVAQWPDSDILQVVSGLDLLTTKGQDGLEQDMKRGIKGIEKVTHVYFFAYIMDQDPAKEVEINIQLLTRAITAVQNLSPNLQFVVMATGTKTYGVHLLDKFPFGDSLPLHEDLPPIPEPYVSQMFYYAQIDTLKKLSAGKAWNWCEVIPDNIIGFVPNNNIYCLAQTLATYLALYVAVEGKSAECAFPGTEKSWAILSNECNQDSVAKFAVHASLHPEVSAGGRFNIADSATPSSWSRKWPVICEYFGLKGTAPPPGGSGPQPGRYVEQHMVRWKELETKYGLQTGRVGNERSSGGFQHFIMSMFDFDRQLDMRRAHEAWGDMKEELDEEGSWWMTFDRFRKAKIIP
ncbi:hypothetical protein VE04_01322 [Pseudogymnoascus sp. 24MN13]|nr:hypothetical protein VE04_01322 [Pseudogymnoascus sp. 24MN13]